MALVMSHRSTAGCTLREIDLKYTLRLLLHQPIKSLAHDFRMFASSSSIFVILPLSLSSSTSLLWPKTCKNASFYTK